MNADKYTPTLPASRGSLPPEGAQPALGRPGGGLNAPSLPASRTRIKICGLTREQDVDAAVAAGADAVGFVLYAPSPRAVTPERAAQLARRLPAFVTPVLLFVNESAPNVIAASALIAGATIQFHGDESPQDCLDATHQGARPYLRAARIPLGDGAASFDLVKYAHDYSHAQAILLDAHVEGFGGSGKAFNWSLLPPSVSSHLVLSGGLTPANVTDGILQVRPRCHTLAVDVSSGVEADGPDGKPIKGIKDAMKIQRFVAAVRAADAQLAKNPHEFLSAT
ncbi:phosphoribosylanthranilate isomerase [Acidovorax radicis]|uniref:phosphoribosylanthranilate isomerase n=1 Tax=Acidovorax radicis TaxID=758826 RepID=UPI0002376A1A